MQTSALALLVSLLVPSGIGGGAGGLWSMTPSSAHLVRRAPYGMLPATPNEAMGDVDVPGNVADEDLMFLGRHKLDRARVGSLGQDTGSEVVRTYFRMVTGAADLELVHVSKEVHQGVAVYGFAQAVQGVAILGTYAIAKVENNSVQYARHILVRPPKIETEPRIDAAIAQRAAMRDIMTFAKGAAFVSSPILSIIYHQEIPVLAYHLTLDSEEPYHFWTVYVDAIDGRVIKREKSGFDCTRGKVLAGVEMGTEGDTAQEMPMPFAQWSRGKATNGQGEFVSETALPTADVSLNGSYFRIEDYLGDAVSARFTLKEDAESNSITLTNARPAQTTPYYHANMARIWAKDRAADVSELTGSRIWNWFNSQMLIRVNLPSGHKGFQCNAFYDGRALNFYQGDSAAGCANTGRVANIIHHEYGHGIHDHLTANEHTLDPQVSEGLADYVAASISGQPAITGLFGPGEVLKGRSTLRSCVNNYTFCRSKTCDSYPGDEPHNAAPILCGALWDLRSMFIEEHGEEKGKRQADAFFLRFASLVTDMSSSYGAAIAADNDEDGDPSNGTDHSCLINEAFIGLPGAKDLPHFPNARRQRVPCVPVAGN